MPYKYIKQCFSRSIKVSLHTWLYQIGGKRHHTNPCWGLLLVIFACLIDITFHLTHMHALPLDSVWCGTLNAYAMHYRVWSKRNVPIAYGMFCHILACMHGYGDISASRACMHVSVTLCTVLRALLHAIHIVLCGRHAVSVSLLSVFILQSWPSRMYRTWT